jgi:(2Fe-2S) ferredoxin
LMGNSPGSHGSGPSTEAAISKKNKSKKGYEGAVATAEAKSATKVRDYESHVLICTGGDCKKRGAKDVRKTLKGELRASGLLGEVRTDTVGCLGLCKHGPNAVVYDAAEPKGTWYLGLQDKDVPEVVEEHLANGAPVRRLAAERRPRKAGKK